MRKVRRLAAAAIVAATLMVPFSATPAQAVCYYDLEGSQVCGDCMDQKLEAILRKAGITIYCLD
jgi:hypothetical protein